MIETINSLLSPTVYKRVDGFADAKWEQTKADPIELSDMIIESDGLYYKFENAGRELKLKQTFINGVGLKTGQQINALIPDTEKELITSIQLTTKRPPANATVYDLTENRTNNIIMWVENGIQYWRCKSRPILNASSTWLFKNYKNVKSIDVVPILDTSKSINIDHMFNNCGSLTSIDLSHFNTSNATFMSGMFYNCGCLTSIDLSSFNTSKATYMNNMFMNCSKITSLNLSGFNTSNVIDMSYMFISCSSLTSLDVSSFNTSKATTMGSMFGYCNKLTSLNISNFDTSKTTTMDSMFGGDIALTNITYGTNFVNTALLHTNVSTSENGAYQMFNSCPANKPTWEYGTWDEYGTFVVTVIFYRLNNKQSNQ